MGRSLHQVIKSALSSLEGVKKAEARLQRAEDQVKAAQALLEKAKEKVESVQYTLTSLEYSGTVFRLTIARKSIAEQEWHYMAKVWFWNTHSRKSYRKGTVFYFHNVISVEAGGYALVARPVITKRHRQKYSFEEGGDAAFLIDQALLDAIELLSDAELEALANELGPNEDLQASA